MTVAETSSRSAAEQAVNRALEGLQSDVAGEAVTDDDVDPAFEQRSAFDVADEPNATTCDRVVRLEGELIALLSLLTDREQPHGRLGHLEDVMGEERAHVGELRQMLGAGVRVRTRVDEHRDRPCDSGS